MDDYVPNSEWEITSNKGQKNVIKYPCCEQPYADLTFEILLNRKVTFHLRLILIPTVLLSIMSVAVFWIPPHRPDRTSIGQDFSTSYYTAIPLYIWIAVFDKTEADGRFLFKLVQWIFCWDYDYQQR